MQEIENCFNCSNCGDEVVRMIPPKFISGDIWYKQLFNLQLCPDCSHKGKNKNANT